MPSMRSVVLSAAAAGVAMAETHVVKVGQEGLTFDPQMTTAAVGDVVEFHFWPQNHSVVAGDMDEGCTPLDDDEAFYSGFMPVTSGMGDMVFQVTVNSTDAMVFYCSQGQHCQNGMYGMINGDDTMLSSYEDLAGDAEDNESPAATSAFGGTVAEASDSTNTTSGDDSEETGSSDDSDSGAGTMAASMGMGVAAFAAALLLA